MDIVLMITVVSGLIGVLCLGGLVFYVRNKIRVASKALLGTTDIVQGFKQIEQEYATTPKSIAGVTRLFLPQILADFPDFHYEEMRERAEHLLLAYLLSIDGFTNKLPSHVTSDLVRQLELQISVLKSKNQREYFKSIKIHDCQLSDYTKQKGKCRITFQASIQYYHYIKDNEGKLVSGNETILFQTRYNIDMIYIQDRDLVEGSLENSIGLNCPNCGAPIKNLGQKFCEYCGTGVVELNINTWSFSDVREV